mgnify:CR=1 FL=1
MTKNIQFYILFILVLIFALLVGGKFPFLLLFIVGLISIFSYLSTYRISKNLTGVFWSDKNYIERGDSVNTTYKVYNSGIFPVPYAVINDEVDNNLYVGSKESQVLFIPSYDYVIIKKEIICNRRGKYNLGKLKINLEDIFGIRKLNISIEDKLNITVYPKLYIIKNIELFGRESFGKRKTYQRYNEDYSNIKNLREYNRGDSLKRVHWKTSAKKGKLIVKNYDTSANLKIKLFMDFELNKYLNYSKEDLEERVVECAISIIYYTLYRNIETDLLTYSEKRIRLSSNNISSFNEFLETMAMIEPKNNIKIGDILLNELNISSLGTTIVVVTPKLDQYLLEALYRTRKNGFNITVFIISEVFTKEIEKKILSLRKILIKVYKVDANKSIEEILG